MNRFRHISYSLLLGVILTAQQSAEAQTRKRKNSKSATQVEAIHAPPRMGGNTGRYGTVTKPRKHTQNRNAKSKKRTHYDYHRHSDDIKPGKN